jgi:hypothetical protein
MSDTIWINIRNGDERQSNEEDHSAILKLTEELDALAVKLNVKPLSAFYDDTDLRFNFDEDNDFDEDDEDDEEGWTNDDANWFDANDAKKSTQTILAALKSNPNIIKLGDWDIADLVWELEDILVELDKAIAQKNPIHFCIVM